MSVISDKCVYSEPDGIVPWRAGVHACVIAGLLAFEHSRFFLISIRIPIPLWLSAHQQPTKEGLLFCHRYTPVFFRIQEMLKEQHSGQAN